MNKRFISYWSKSHSINCWWFIGLDIFFFCKKKTWLTFVNSRKTNSLSTYALKNSICMFCMTEFAASLIKLNIHLSYTFSFIFFLGISYKVTNRFWNLCMSLHSWFQGHSTFNTNLKWFMAYLKVFNWK